jgi:hypothetical protein
MTRTALSLLFFKDGGVRFAVDREQVLAVQAPGPAAETDLPHVLDALGGNRLGRATGSPLMLCLGTEPPTRILVDAMETIAEIQKADLRPLPSLVAAKGKALGLWAVAIVKGELVLLVDFQYLQSKLLPGS